MAELPSIARNAGCCIWAFVSPTESDFDVYPSSAMGDGSLPRTTTCLSAATGARIFKHTIAVVSLLAGLFFVTAGTVIFPSSLSLILGGGALTFSIGCYICMLRQNQSDKGRGLPFCGIKPLHINQKKNRLEEEVVLNDPPPN